MVNDSIGDLIIQLKNAGAVGIDCVSTPHSKFKFAVADKLAEKGYVKSVEKRGKKVHKTLTIQLLYDKDGKHAIRDVKRVSKLGRRIYRSVSRIHPVKYGKGMLILSTPKGVLTGEEARKKNVGGEALFEIW